MTQPTILQEVLINDNTGTVCSGSVTVSAGTNRRVFVLSTCFAFGGAETVTAATLGAVNITQVGLVNTATANGNPCLYIGEILDANIPAGANTLSITWSGGSVEGALVIVWKDCNQSATTLFSGPSGVSSGQPAAMSFGAVSTNDSVLCVGAQDTATVATIPTGYTATTNASWGDASHKSAGAYKFGAGATESPAFTFDGIDHAAQAGVVVYGTAASGPVLSAESVTAIAATTATVQATSSSTGTAYIVPVASGAGQPTDATFLASSFTASVTAATPFSVNLTGLTAAQLTDFWIGVYDGTNWGYASITDLTSHTGYSRITLGTPNTTAANRLTSTPDLASGDIIDWNNIVGTGTVTVNSDATYDATATVNTFDFYVGTLASGWGTSGSQTVTLDTIPPTLTETRRFFDWLSTVGISLYRRFNHW